MDEIRYEGLDIVASYERCGELCPGERHQLDGGYHYVLEPGFPCDSPVGHMEIDGYHAPYRWGDRFTIPSSIDTDAVDPIRHPRWHKDNFRPASQFWVEYPIRPDANLRKLIYWSEFDNPESKGVMAHPAKAPLRQMEDIIRLVSKPGDLIMDIFGGIGTTMIGARENRNILLMEIGAPFFMLQKFSLDKMKRLGFIGSTTNVFLQFGDNRELLRGHKGTIDHAMFSPPYADTLSFKAKAESTQYLGGSTYAGDDATFGDYTTDKGNLGALPDFKFRMAMRGIYQQVFEALKPGGTMTTIMGDNMKGGQRLLLSDNVIKACKRAGFLPEFTWLYRFMGGTGFKKDWMEKGVKVVLNEDVMIFRKPG